MMTPGALAISGVTPIGQDWTNARGLQGLGGPKPDPKITIKHKTMMKLFCI